MWKIVKVEREIVQVYLQIRNKGEVLAEIWDEVVALVLQDPQSQGANHFSMDRHLGLLKTSDANLVAETQGDADRLVLRVYHVQNRLVDKNVLILHLLNPKLKVTGELGAIFQLWKLDHFPMFDIDKQSSRLVNDLTFGYLAPLLFADF